MPVFSLGIAAHFGIQAIRTTCLSQNRKLTDNREGLVSFEQKEERRAIASVEGTSRNTEILLEKQN